MKKQLEEERFHFAHGVAWLKRLSSARPAGRKDLAAAFRGIWTPVLLWFGRPGAPADGALLEAGVVSWGADELRRRLLERLGPALRDARLGLVTERDGRWSAKGKLTWPKGWDDARRRARSTGPDEATVARARGDRNRMFLMD